ncbi:VOC family protein [Paenibacillus odorifer]|uniref:Glutathione transferase n=1 Tax=Paenibacillus odorifer TaxID=189426 RepID=A0A1R0WXN0_9BACL|nr:VOC family protein [Paenibacillus odorifer]AIQ75548.1 glutathione transferase [Paenibacillus odorifer]OMC97278.1 glutathione transferase [Paenibacillus odorifer]OMD06890.1 glutathione transferase [Paenibacillus odorifer]OMD23592.1 glutathione transferase [Paenibacillus odorifer]OMD32368.1 glutathione transferase [Paenibacillus odorifer]
MQVEGFNHVTVNVSNLANSLNFYTGVLGLQLVHRGKTDAYLEWGSAWICLLEKPDYMAIADKVVGVDHIAFSIAEEHFEEAVQVLQTQNVPIIRGPIKRGIGWTVNFLDPDGIQLELHTSNLRERMSVWNTTTE